MLHFFVFQSKNMLTFYTINKKYHTIKIIDTLFCCQKQFSMLLYNI